MTNDPTAVAVEESPPRAKSLVLKRILGYLVSGRMFALLIVLVVLFSILNPRFFTMGNLFTLARQMSLILVVSLGATFVILMGMIDLSVGSVITLAGIITAALIPSMGVSGALVAIAVGILCGLLNGLIVTGLRLPSFLVTLGTLSVFQGVALTLSVTYQTFDNPLLVWVSRQNSVFGFPNIAIWALVLYAILVFVGLRTRFGRYSYAIGGGELVSRLSGISVNRFKLYGFALSGATAAIAGVLLAGRIGAGTPQMGEGFMLDSIAAICIGGTSLSGGVGGVHRTLLGALIITVLSAGLNMIQVEPNFQIMIKGFIVIVAVYFTLDRRKSVIVK